MDAYEFEFIIKDKESETIVHRSIIFSYPIPAQRIDYALAMMFLVFFEELAGVKEGEEDESETVN